MGAGDKKQQQRENKTPNAGNKSPSAGNKSPSAGTDSENAANIDMLLKNLTQKRVLELDSELLHGTGMSCMPVPCMYVCMFVCMHV